MTQQQQNRRHSVEATVELGSAGRPLRQDVDAAPGAARAVTAMLILGLSQ